MASLQLIYISMPFQKVRLESNLKWSYFPADSAMPVPLAVGSLDSRYGQMESR